MQCIYIAAKSTDELNVEYRILRKHLNTYANTTDTAQTRAVACSGWLQAHFFNDVFVYIVSINRHVLDHSILQITRLISPCGTYFFIVQYLSLKIDGGEYIICQRFADVFPFHFLFYLFDHQTGFVVNHHQGAIKVCLRLLFRADR